MTDERTPELPRCEAINDAEHKPVVVGSKYHARPDMALICHLVNEADADAS